MLSKEDADRIEQAIRQAEAKTGAEIAVHLRRSSGQDRGIAAMAGVLVLAIAVAAIDLIWQPGNLYVLLGIGLLLAILAFVLCDHFDVGLRLLPARLLTEDARRAARAHFLDRGLDATPERNAVLLFVSRAERYVEILPDRGLAAQVPQQRWVNIVTRFQETARGRGMVEAVAEAVAAIGAVCAGPFPAGIDNPDLVSNRPVSE